MAIDCYLVCVSSLFHSSHFRSLFRIFVLELKNIKMGRKYICFAIIGLGLISSCVKKNNPPAQSPSYTISATISGTSWSESTLKATNTNGLDSIKGIRNSDSSAIMLLFPSGPKAGDTLKLGSVNTIEYINGNISYIAISGSIVITSTSITAISGTFQGTVEDFNTSNKITINEGIFAVKFLN